MVVPLRNDNPANRFIMPVLGVVVVANFLLSWQRGVVIAKGCARWKVGKVCVDFFVLSDLFFFFSQKQQHANRTAFFRPPKKRDFGAQIWSTPRLVAPNSA